MTNDFSTNLDTIQADETFDDFEKILAMFLLGKEVGSPHKTKMVIPYPKRQY